MCLILNRLPWIVQRLDSAKPTCCSCCYVESLLTVSGVRTSGRDNVDRLTHEIGAELDCRVSLEPALILWLLGPTAQYRCAQIDSAMLTKLLIAIPARDLREGLKHITWYVDVHMSALMQSSALGPLTAPSARKGRASAAGCSSKSGVGPQLPRPTHGPKAHPGQAAGATPRSIRPEAQSRQCVVADGVVVQSGHRDPIRAAVDVPN